MKPIQNRINTVLPRFKSLIALVVIAATVGFADFHDIETAVIEGVTMQQSAGGMRLVVRLHSTSDIARYVFDAPEGSDKIKLTLLNTHLSAEALLDPARDPIESYRLFQDGSKVVLEGILGRSDVSVSVKSDASSHDLLLVISALPGIRMLTALADSASADAAIERALPSQKMAPAAPTLLVAGRNRPGIPGVGTTGSSAVTATSAVADQPVSDVERLFSTALKKSEEAAPAVTVPRTAEGTKRWKLDTIVLDAGHGGWDEGAFGKAGFLEKELALIVALRVGRMIEEKLGVNVVYTRTDDRFIPVSERGHIANEAGGKLFISIHANYSTSRQAHGTETYFLGVHRTDSARVVMDRENQVIQLEEDQGRYTQFDKAAAARQALAQSSFMRHSELLAEAIQQQFTDVVGRRDRGVKQAGFYVLFGASMPAVLIELGFLSNPSEEKFLSTTDGQTSMANAIFRAVQDFKIEYEKPLQVAAE